MLKALPSRLYSTDEIVRPLETSQWLAAEPKRPRHLAGGRENGFVVMNDTVSRSFRTGERNSNWCRRFDAVSVAFGLDFRKRLTAPHRRDATGDPAILTAPDRLTRAGARRWFGEHQTLPRTAPDETGPPRGGPATGGPPRTR